MKSVIRTAADGPELLQLVGRPMPEPDAGWTAGVDLGGRVGAAQQYTLAPDRHAVSLPDHAPFELGTALGVTALTTHRALTVHDGGPGRIAPGTLRGATVLVAAGAGAVGNAAIQLSRWA